jgi:hypothetical protein
MLKPNTPFVKPNAALVVMMTRGDIRLRPGIEVFVGLGGTGQHSQLQDGRQGKTAQGAC